MNTEKDLNTSVNEENKKYKGPVIKNPIKAIREKCVECVGSRHEVAFCNGYDCPLFQFRHGKNPFRAKREMTEDQRQASIERLKKARDSKINK